MKTEFVRYLERLSELYPTIDKASTEIINLMMYSGIHLVQMTRVSLRHLFTIQKKK